MNAFRFPLAAILTLREEREQEAQRQYAARLRTVESANRAIQATRQELLTLAEEHGTSLRQGAPADGLQRLDQYRHVLDERLTRLHKELAAARLAAERAWRALLKATQDRQALEKYQQRLRRVHDSAVARAEQRLLDEFSGRAHTFTGAWRQTAEDPAP